MGLEATRYSTSHTKQLRAAIWKAEGRPRNFIEVQAPSMTVVKGSSDVALGPGAGSRQSLGTNHLVRFHDFSCIPMARPAA